MNSTFFSRGVRGLLCVTVFGAVGYWQVQDRAAPPAAAQETAAAVSGFVIEPYLQFVTKTSITIMCETPIATRCKIEYGMEAPGKQRLTSSNVQMLHEFRLENLTPKSRYFYRVTCTDPDGNAITSKELSFATAVDEDDAWSFAVVGDTQANPKMTGQICSKIWNRRPNMIVHCGDVVDDGANKRMWVQELFGPYPELFGRVPVFPCIGNHEKNHANYYAYFSLPKPEYYYSYTYGNAEFFSIDTNKKVQPGSEQYEWLDKALAQSKATWKICYHHHPAYSSDSNDYGNTFKKFPTNEGDANARHLTALYEKHNVDLVFNGHIHVYERTWPLRGGKVDRKTGVRYITSGGGGGSLEDFSPTPAFFKAEFRSDFHYCYLTVHQGKLCFKAFDKDDRLFDQFEIDKGP